MPSAYQTPETEAAGAVNQLLEKQVSELYVKKYYTSEKKKQLFKMYQDIKEGYGVLIRGADWLSAKTKSGLIKKLDNMLFVPVGGKIKKAEKEDEKQIGENAFFTFINSKKKNYENSLSMIGEKHDKEFSIMSSQTVNAAYTMDNAFHITLAIMHAPYFDEKADYFTNLGGLGMVIAHEMGHAFDPNCILFDMDGNYDPEWIEEKDREKLKNRMDQMIGYYSSFVIMDVYHVNGRQTCGENFADKGGMECIMKIADTKEEKKRVFKNYARIWCTMMEDRISIEKLQTDEHSPECVRVNAVLASTEEFYEVYNVMPGDRMYVEPEKRVKRW